jgi:uncharacterized membrane protein
MNSIAVLSPYFGELPFYFSKWLDSARHNKNITFIIIGDVNMNISLPNNVLYKQYSFENLQKRIKEMFGYKSVIDKPYKLADYRPAFGLLFHDFWGYTDLDIILGNLDKYITTEKLQKYDKIGVRGHFSIYRNVSRINEQFLNTNMIRNTVTYKTAFLNKGAFHFDEDWGVGTRFLKQNILIDDLLSPQPVMADISPKKFNFHPINRDIKDAIYVWKQGRLYETSISNIGSEQKEVMYVHLQKRTLHDFTDGTVNSFIISAHGIFELNSAAFMKLSKDELTSQWAEGSFAHYCHYYLNVIKSGEMKARLYKWLQI